MGNKILVVVDMQNDFLTGALKNDDAIKVIGNVERKIKESCRNGDDIIFTMDLHNEDYMATEEGKNLPVPHCIDGTDGCKIYSPVIGSAVKNTPGIFDTEEDKVTIVCKNTFGSVSLGELIRDRVEKGLQTNNAVTEIELIGVCTDICVISNALLVKAFVPNLPVSVDAACCAGVTPESHDTAIKAMEACQIHVRNKGDEPWRKQE